MTITYSGILKHTIDKVFETFPNDKNLFKLKITNEQFKEFQNYKDEQFSEIITNGIKAFGLKFLEDQIRNYLVQEGYLEATKNYDLETRLTDKGLEAKSLGTIELYQQYIKEQRTLQLNVLRSTVETNQSVRTTNKIQIGSLILSGLIALMACIFQGLSYKTDKEQQEQISSFQKQLNSSKADIQKLSKSFQTLQQKLNDSLLSSKDSSK